LVDAWFVPADERLVAFLDAPEERSFDWVIDETARVLAISPEAVELRMLVSLRDRWAFRGDPAVPDPTRRNPRAARWDRIDVAADDQTIRVSSSSAASMRMGMGLPVAKGSGSPASC
jgi:hypothetical protein